MRKFAVGPKTYYYKLSNVLEGNIRFVTFPRGCESDVTQGRSARVTSLSHPQGKVANLILPDSLVWQQFYYLIDELKWNFLHSDHLDLDLHSCWHFVSHVTTLSQSQPRIFPPILVLVGKWVLAGKSWPVIGSNRSCDNNKKSGDVITWWCG